MSTKVANKKAAPAKKPTTKKVAATESAPVEEKKVAPKKTTAKTKKVAPKVEAPAPEAEVATEKVKRERREVTRESVDSCMASLQKKVEDQIEKLRSSPDDKKTKGVKFLRTVNKDLKGIMGDYTRVLKMKPKSTRPRPKDSGFMKPVAVSDDMLKFTGWEAGKEYSRVDVTRFICKYIKENELQNQDDKREIVCDAKLGALLTYVPETDEEGKKKPLTYFLLQKCIQKHFIKPAKTEVTKKAATKKVVAASVEEEVEEDEE